MSKLAHTLGCVVLVKQSSCYLLMNQKESSEFSTFIDISIYVVKHDGGFCDGVLFSAGSVNTLARGVTLLLYTGGDHERAVFAHHFLFFYETPP